MNRRIRKIVIPKPQRFFWQQKIRDENPADDNVEKEKPLARVSQR